MTNHQEEVLQQLCNHITGNLGFGGELHVDESLVEQLALDSVKVLNLIMEVEDEFDVTIPINALADINTPRQLAVIISDLQG